MSKRANMDSPEDTGRNGVDGMSRRAFLKASAVGAGAAAAAAGMAQVAKAGVEGPKPARLDTLKSDKPHGGQLVAHAVRKIKSAGMKPGIWVHRVHRPSDPHVADIGKQHPDWFVHKPNGDLFMDAGFYILNTKN